MKLNIDSLDFSKGNGLVPGVIQDDRSRQVLMVGYFNREALEKTITEKRVTFYSRSKGRLWTKGETSGNFLELRSITADCDQDALLVRVMPKGPVCHTGAYGCFDSQIDARGFLYQLEEVIARRAAAGSEDSYTHRLLAAGPKKIGQKVGEEGVEVALESERGDPEALVNETADLLYHLQVLFQSRGIKWEEAERVLLKRHA